MNEVLRATYTHIEQLILIHICPLVSHISDPSSLRRAFPLARFHPDSGTPIYTHYPDRDTREWSAAGSYTQLSYSHTLYNDTPNICPIIICSSTCHLLCDIYVY